MLALALCAAAASARRVPGERVRASMAHVYEHVYALTHRDADAANDELALAWYVLAEAR